MNTFKRADKKDFGAIPKDELVSALKLKKVKKKEERVWKDADIIKLIDLYESEPALWNQTIAAYSNKDEKAKSCDRVVEGMMEDSSDEKNNPTLEDCKRKWTILRGQFLREADMERKKKSGQGTDELYVSNWRWFKSLKFLDVCKNACKGIDSRTDSVRGKGLRHQKTPQYQRNQQRLQR